MKVPETTYRELAAARGFTYTGGYSSSVKRKVGWACGQGHRWEARYADIRRGTGCPHCAGVAVIPETAYQELAESRSFTYTGGYCGNVKSKVGWVCGKGHHWRAPYTHIQRGCGCPHCSGNARLPETAYQELAAARGFTYTGGYSGNVDSKVGWMCSQGHRWEAIYSSIRWGRGCPHCAGVAVIPEAAYQELAESRSFTYAGGYCGSIGRKVGWACSKGHRWEATYNSIRRGTGCPYCSGNARLPETTYQELAEARGITYTGGYSGRNKSKVGWMCSKGHRWEATYNDIKRGRGCPQCKRARLPETAYQELAAERGIAYTGEYSGSTARKVGWACSKGHRWKAKYNSIQEGTGCPQCSSSKGEQAIARAFERWGIQYEIERRFRACRDKGTLPFDFFIPKWGVLVEFQGVQHYEVLGNEFFGGEDSLAERQRRDGIKREFADKYGYKLIEVPHTVENIPHYLGMELARVTGKSYEEITRPGRQDDGEQGRGWAGEMAMSFFDFVQPGLFGDRE